MRIDLRCKYDSSLRKKAAELVDAGYGWDSLSRELAIPRATAKNWIMTYRANGLEALIRMGSKRNIYGYEQKLAAARDVVDGGRTVQEAMAEHGVASRSVLQRWCREYREGGPDALRPKPKGRPPGSEAAVPKSRGQELEERVRKLEAENAYLKKLHALRVEKRLRTGRDPK